MGPGHTLRPWLVLAACLATGDARAVARDTLRSSTPDKPVQNYAEDIVMSFPDGGRPWHLDNRFDRPNNAVQEWVREGETVHGWSEIITLITLKDLPDTDTRAMIEGTIGHMKERCPNLQVLSSAVGEETDALRQGAGLPATYPTFSAFVRCDDPLPSDNPSYALKKHEVTWFKGIQGWKTAYLLERAWHGDEIPPGTVLESDKTRADWQRWADGIRIRGLPGGKRPK